MRKKTYALVALFLAMTVTAEAANGAQWLGREIDNSRIHWHVINKGGDTWSIEKNAVEYGLYETVYKGNGYIEMQAKDTKTFDRIRLYRDRLDMNKDGSKFQWVTMAKGKWHN